MGGGGLGAAYPKEATQLWARHNPYGIVNGKQNHADELYLLEDSLVARTRFARREGAPGLGRGDS